MTEWRLYPEGTVPAFTQPAFFEAHDWIPPEVQTGHRERVTMVATMVAELEQVIAEVIDLGAGDGSLIAAIAAARPGPSVHGYDLGAANLRRAAQTGRDVAYGNIVDELEQLLAPGISARFAVIVCTEVVEHLLDPHAFVRRLAAASAGRTVILSSPSSENALNHYEHHAWAWDLDGYRQLVEAAGFTVLDQRETSAGSLRFQAVTITTHPDKSEELNP